MPKIILRQKQKDTSDRGKYRGAAGYGVYILYVLHEPTGKVYPQVFIGV